MSGKIAMGATAVVVLALGAGAMVVTLGQGDDVFAHCRTSTIAGGTAQIGGAFTLTNQAGETVTEAQVIDQPTLIYFGYTFCPDVCPLDSARNAEAVALLDERGIAVKPVFITIDPERDTPEVLAEFTDYQHPRMEGLTGTPDQIKAVSKAYRAYFKKQNAEEGDEFYLMDHSTFSYLVTPENGFVEFFRREVRAEQLADQLQCFVEAV